MKLNFFDLVVSPPHKRILYFFCSSASDFEILSKFVFEKKILFPDAEIKFYITASLKDRANRRFEELVLNNPKIDKKLVIKELQKRDQRDMERSTAPLKIAKDAIVIDTTDLTIEEVNSRVQKEIEKVIK